MLTVRLASAIALLVKVIWLAILSRGIPLVSASDQIPLLPHESQSQDSCARWTKENDLNGRISAKFEIPLENLDKMFMFSRGATGGSLRIQDIGFESRVATVYVLPTSTNGNKLPDTSVCRIEREGGSEIGLGFFLPDSHSRENFETIIYLPRRPGGGRPYLKKLETDLPRFTQAFEDLSESVDFGAISLKTDFSPIKIQSIQADSITVHTRGGPITGSFQVSTSLALQTENGHIKVDVHLLNNPYYRANTELLMSTNHGPIEARLFMQSTQNRGGQFKVVASTERSPINLISMSAPIDSSLSIAATTTMAPCFIQLPASYEGDFTLRSTVHRPELRYNTRELDPSGLGRHRSVRVKAADTYVSGRVSWSGISRGIVDVETSNAPLTLKF